MSKLRRVTNKVDFKKKINAFLKDSDGIGSDAIELLAAIKKLTNIYLIGGALRNVLHEEQVRDLDFIVTCPISESLISVLPKGHKVNRMGGVKVNLRLITFDLWSVNDNWANRKKLINTEHIHISEIAKGTFYNFDSIVYSLNSNVLHCSFYDKCVNTGILDIIKHNRRYIYTSPNRAANVIRAFYLRRKYGLTFSQFLTDYMSLQINSLSYEHLDLVGYFKSVLRAYPKYSDHLTPAALESEIVALQSADDRPGDLDIGLFNS